MTNSFLKISSLCLIGVISALPARAQNCDVVQELIFSFHESEAGAYSIWDSTVGEEDRDERFVGVVPEGRASYALGERYALNGADLQEIFFVRFDHRGRPNLEKPHKIEGLREVSQFLKTPSGYVALGRYNVAGKMPEIWFGVFNDEGDLIKQTRLAHKGGQLYGHYLLPRAAGGYLLAASLKPLKKDGYNHESAQHAVLYHLDKNFNAVQQAGLLPGVENRVLGLSERAGGDYVAAGYVTQTDGRQVGWVLHLGPDGHIIWQREYARGAKSHLKRVVPFLDDGLILGGEADPLPGSGGYRAGWVMVIDVNRGDVQWQRYYKGSSKHEMRDIVVRKDNTISVLLNAEPSAENEQKFARILRLNRRGILLETDTYFNGEGARANTLNLGLLGERYLAGSSHMRYIIEAQNGGDDIIRRSLDAWVSVGAINKPYSDPCD